MTPRVPALLMLCLLTASAGCADAPSGGSQALHEALARTTPLQEDGSGAASGASAPLASATPHRLVMKATMQLTPASGPHTLTITRTVDRGERGTFRLTDRRTLVAPGVTDSYEEGRDAVFDGARFASRRGHGRWIARDPIEGGRDRLLREAYDLAPGLLGSLGSYLRWKQDPASRELLAGIPVVWAVASLDPRVGPRPLDDDALEALKNHDTHWTAWVGATHRPTKVDGTLARTTLGEVLAGHLAISGDATVEGQTVPFMLRVDYTMGALPKAAATSGFSLPKDVLPEARPRPWKMIKDVMGEDLAPAYR